MRALVTGASGFLGAWLVRHLAARGDVAVALTHADADVRDPSAVADAVRRAAPDSIFHLAARASVARSFAEPRETFETNVLGTVSVLEAARRHAPLARVVFASSADVYGAVDADELPLDESRRPEPASPYAASKAAAEEVALGYVRAFGLDVRVARCFNVVGPGQSTDFALPGFAAQLAAVAAGRAEPVLRVGNLDARRDLTDARDAARGLAAIADCGAPGGVYNICSGVDVSMRSALATLVAASGLDVAVEVEPSRLRPIDVPRLVGSGERLTRASGWRPEIPIDRSLADLYLHARSLTEASD